MEDVDLDAIAKDLGFVLKAEQKAAVESLLVGKDVFAVLPTGFGKSLIFQLFVLAKSRASSSLNGALPSIERPTIIVISPLKSIVEEQIKSNEFNLTAAELRFDVETLNAVKNGETQVVYAAAEQVLNEKFTSLLKEDCPFRRSLSLIVVDESHTVLTCSLLKCSPQFSLKQGICDKEEEELSLL
ncbi:hypothetical protein ACROYT_G030961 [Oculina patagonica]